MGGEYQSYNVRTTKSRIGSKTTRVSKAKSPDVFFKSKKTKDLVDFVNENGEKGFIKKLLQHQGLDKAPKEFPEIEYEIKFEIGSIGIGLEPSIEEYLDAFEFPPTKNARFLKDPIHNIAVGNNHFYGENGNERLVVIEKAGNQYLKEKSQPLKVDVSVPYQDIVVKRTEDRYQASLDEILKKTNQVNQDGAEYKGFIEKDKGDDFILDTFDGRIYSYTVTLSYRNGDKKQIQRQLELEYAGYVPGFSGCNVDSEKEIIEGMIRLAMQSVIISEETPINKDRKMRLYLTNQRKYDFVSGNTQKPLQLEKIPLRTDG